MTDVKTCYKIYNDKLLIIIISFKHWCHYLNGNQHFIKILMNHNNLWYFMNKARLNNCQSWWFIMLAFYDFVIIHQFGTHNSADGLSHQPDYEQDQKEVNCLSTLQQKFLNLSVEALHLPEAQQQVMLNTYGLCLACISVLQYLHLREERKTEAKAEKQSISPESSQIDTIQIWRKKHRFTNSSLKMQERPKGLLKILKSHEDLQRPALKIDGNNLNNFRNSLKPLRNPLESFENTSEREVEPKDSSEDLNKDQLEAEWAWLRPEKMQVSLLQHIIHNYAWKENLYFKSFSFFKFIIHSLQNFNSWIKKIQKKTEAEIYLKKYQFNAESFLQYQETLYLSKNYALLTKVIKRHHDNFYAEHFKYKKIIKII